MWKLRSGSLSRPQAEFVIEGWQVPFLATLDNQYAVPPHKSQIHMLCTLPGVISR